MKRFWFAFLIVMLSANVACAAGTRHLTPTEIEHLKQAIIDEIYDYGHYSQFYEIGENAGTPRHWIGRIHLFINPIYNSVDNHGEVM